MSQDTPGLPPPRPIALTERAAMIFVEYARLDVEDGCFVAIDEGGVRTWSAALCVTATFTAPTAGGMFSTP